MANELIIWNFFKNKGLSDFGIAGLMGNLRAESGLNPKNLQNSYERSLGLTDSNYTAAVDNGSYTNFIHDKAGYGLAQWTYWNRKQNLFNFAKQKNKSIGDLDMQLEFLYQELTKNYSTIWNSLKSSTSVREASDIVLTQFEKPANQSESVKNTRANWGQEYYNQFAKSKYYRVQIGAFKNKANAEKLQQQIKVKGFDCILKQYGGLYKCQVGAFGVELNAEKLQKQLINEGFVDCFIVYN